MGTVEAHVQSSGQQTNGEVTAGCAACSHARTEHDAIAARYCNATIAGQFKRGCVCTSVKQPGKTG